MREIKFRAWDDAAKEMIECTGCWFEEEGNYHEKDLAKVAAPKVLMQFTGLKDKNGKEIWEGDVVRWEWHRMKKKPVYGPACEVTFGTLYESDGENRTGWIALDSFVTSDCEVIGNIYENPELLK